MLVELSAAKVIAALDAYASELRAVVTSDTNLDERSAAQAELSFIRTVLAPAPEDDSSVFEVLRPEDFARRPGSPSWAVLKALAKHHPALYAKCEEAAGRSLGLR